MRRVQLCLRRRRALPRVEHEVQQHGGEGAEQDAGATMFVNVQHPGETPSDRSDPAEPAKFPNWPDYQAGGRPRSATVVITKCVGGVIGS